MKTNTKTKIKSKTKTKTKINTKSFKARPHAMAANFAEQKNEGKI